MGRSRGEILEDGTQAWTQTRDGKNNQYKVPKKYIAETGLFAPVAPNANQ